MDVPSVFASLGIPFDGDLMGIDPGAYQLGCPTCKKNLKAFQKEMAEMELCYRNLELFVGHPFDRLSADRRLAQEIIIDRTVAAADEERKRGSPKDATVLEKWAEKNGLTPSAEQIHFLAETTGRKRKAIDRWFREKRAKRRRVC